MDQMFLKFLNDESHYVNGAMFKNFEDIMNSFLNNESMSDELEESKSEDDTLQISKSKSVNAVVKTKVSGSNLSNGVKTSITPKKVLTPVIKAEE